jgi:Ni,Fe-hydrogenase III small subunit
VEPLRIDLGRCVFCGECQLRQPEYIRFTNDHRLATTVREALVVAEGDDRPIPFHAENVRPEIPKLFRNALKLRQVSAGGDNSCEMELNASGNVNFDFGRYGVDFVASPRHADGLVVTGPITENMAAPLETAYDAVPEPKIVVLVGTDAISGGVFAESPAIDRSFLDRHRVDLYVPGNPAHPLTYIDGILNLIGRKEAGR